MPATPKKYCLQIYFWSWNMVPYLQHLQLHTVTPQLSVMILLRYPGLRQPEVEACDLALPTREDLKLIEETREEKVIVVLMLVIMMER